MLRRVALIAAAILLALWGVRFVRGCGVSDEDRVRAVIDAIEDGVERRDLGDVMAHIAERYQDRDGLRRNMIKGLLLQEFLGHPKGISIQRLGGTDVRLFGPANDRRTAKVGFRARIAGDTSLGALAGGESWDFEVTLRKEDDGAWRVESHTRAPAGGQ